ncbi:amidohydrolase [Hyalangium gracile]|uniref:amidohydrolase n=1 Tax=Hyalangium gracile TaxID=394092 RepID=UPI001CC9E67B|nr:amidohydrolase family protein [Hyalangium gracile]
MPRRSPRSAFPLRHLPWPSVLLGLGLGLLCACATTGGGGRPSPESSVTVFIGKILTMDDQGTIAEAVSVDSKGRILEVGTEKELLQAPRGQGMKIVRLEPQQVLLPGFIEPHMHTLMTLIQDMAGLHDLAPCLPGPYSSANPSSCKNELLEALQTMQPAASAKAPSDEFLLGVNLDPSRQQFSPSPCAGQQTTPSFADLPKKYLAACVSADRPVFIVDQSGHLAYVNQKAIDVTCASLKKEHQECPPASMAATGGEWVKGKDGQFTGLIREEAGFKPFLQAMGKSLTPLALLESDPRRLIAESTASMKRTIQEMREAGLTTLSEGGLMSKQQLEAAKLLAEDPAFPMRMTGVVFYQAAYDAKEKRELLRPTGPACDPQRDASCKLPKWLGAGSIKLWVDGSTQGCTAKLQLPYRYQSPGHCAGSEEGRANYKGPADVADQLRPLWLAKEWRFQVHANGNEAIQWAIDAFASLQQEAQNPHRVLFIHDTVGALDTTQRIAGLRNGSYVAKDGKKTPPLDARVTHLIGHVAYWGNAFVGMLGEDAARNIDPVGFDRQYGVPFSLHSDSFVTPPRPLWYVEQAVTRRTWAYPALEKSFVLGPEHVATVQEALRAITLEPARQHELDAWLGSIEQGKIADFVVLDANPLDFDPSRGGDPTKISKIRVVQTYLNGEPTAGGR